MSLALYMDHHVPLAITEGLRSRAVDVLTSAEDGTADWDDELILERATRLLRVVVTQDRDFLVIAAACQSSGKEFSGVVYGHQMDVTIGQGVRDLEILAKVLDPADMQNRVEFLPLS